MILNIYSSRGHGQWNVQWTEDIISFIIYDSYFHHDVRGHGAGVTLPISMHMDLFFFVLFFCDFPADFSLFFSLCLSLFNVHFIGHLSHIFVLALLIH